MVKAGAALLILGVAALVGYVLYGLVWVLYIQDVLDIPLVLQVAVPGAMVGLVLLVAAAVRDRLRTRRRETFNKEVEN